MAWKHMEREVVYEESGKPFKVSKQNLRAAPQQHIASGSSVLPVSQCAGDPPYLLPQLTGSSREVTLLFWLLSYSKT